MVNKQRVRRIKNIIYAFIIVVLFLPLILLSFLSFRMLGIADTMSAKLDELKTTVAQAVPNDSASSAESSTTVPESGYVIEPEGQSAKNESLVAPIEDEPIVQDNLVASPGNVVAGEDDLIEDSTVDSAAADIASGDVTAVGEATTSKPNQSSAKSSITPAADDKIKQSSSSGVQGGGDVASTADGSEIGENNKTASGNTAGSTGGGADKPATSNGSINDAPQKNYNGNPLTGR